MIIITDANGNLQAPTIPENIYQGSNKANSIILLSPLAQSNTATIMFRLPDGLLTPEYLMTHYDDVPSQYKLNAWVRDIDSDITALYGTVTYQIKLTNANGTIVTSVAGTFNVSRGVAPLPSTTPSTTNWTEILSYLSQINSDIENGWLVSKGILPYDANFAYPLNASVWNKTNNTIYTSLVDDNLGNALTDTSKWGATSLVAMSDLDDYYTKGETDNLLNNKANISDVPTKTSDLTNDNGFITNTVDNLANYYKKSETYTQTEVNALIQNINAIQIRNVNNEAINATSSTVQNVATQYIVDNYNRQPQQLDGLIITLTDQNNDKVLFVYSETSSLWINVGLNGVDLSNYYTKSETQSEIAKTDVTSITSIDAVIGTPMVNYNTTDGITIESTAKIVYGENNKEKEINLSQEIPLVCEDNSITIDANETNEKILIKANVNNNVITKPTEAPASQSIVSIDTNNEQQNLTLGSNLSINNGVLNATSGGSKLYEHTLRFVYEGVYLLTNILLRDRTILNNESVAQFLYNNNFNNIIKLYPVGSNLLKRTNYINTIRSASGIYSEDGIQIEMDVIDKSFIINDNNINIDTETTSSIITLELTDNVREL